MLVLEIVGQRETEGGRQRERWKEPERKREREGRRQREKEREREGMRQRERDREGGQREREPGGEVGR